MQSKPPVCAASTPLALPAASNTYDYVQLDDAERSSTPLAEEVALAIVYNGLNQAVMLVSPTDEIYDVKLSGSGSAMYADLEISSRAFWSLKDQRRQLAGTSGCGLCGVEALEQALPELNVLPGAPLPPVHWLKDLRQRIDAFQPLGQHCGAVHAALFMDRDGQLLLGREDIGRHNALDKLVGALLRQRIDTAGGLAIVTSRCSLELIQKVLRAGIQTLVSLSAPTGLALQWARKHNLNLIHLPKHSAPRVFSPAAE